MLNKPKILTINTQFGSDIAKKLGLYGGVGYYRQRMVAKHLPEYLFNHVGGRLVNTPPENLEKVLVEMIETHDLVYTKHLDNPSAIYMLLGACDYYKKPLIIDFDDNVFADDGKNPDAFVYKEGSEMKHYMETLLREATAITVSTEPLVEVYKKYNKNVHLLPNSCDMDDWNWTNRKHLRKTVGWAGSGSHVVDHPVMKDEYQKVIEKNPDVVFSFVGHMLPKNLRNVPRKNWEIKPALSWWAGNPNSHMTYPRLLAEQGYDIGLAPLIDSQFNEARSLVKWFEYTMTGIPTIVSDIGPYKELRDGIDVYKEDWEESIDYLLKNPNEGKRLVDNSRKRIEQEYSIEHTTPRWRTLFDKYLGRGFRK